MKTYINNDERLGDHYEFTMPEMIEIYRGNHWDRRDDGTTMTEAEIEEQVLSYEVEEHDAI